MHYATKLKLEIEKRDDIIAMILEKVREFKCHLELAKFRGVGKDYIQTADVHNWLYLIEGAEFGKPRKKEKSNETT
jgi:hypothetical protein